MKKEELLNKVDSRIIKGIAHRGLHNEIYTENGLKAFKNALDNNLAIELDIHLTKDKKLVVCHDSNLKRTTNKEGIIEELTLEEIENNYTLLDGGKIPTLEDVLSLVNEQVPLVIELKVENKNYKELGDITRIELGKHIKNKKMYMFISFDPRALLRVRKMGVITSFLICKAKGWTYMFRHLFDSIDIEWTMVEEKRVKRYSKHHFVNVWTIENKEQVEKVKPYCSTMTFQHIDKDIIFNALSEK